MSQTKKPASFGNVLIVAEYAAPKSGNFIASLLDLADQIKNEGNQTTFLFPAVSQDRAWVTWILENGYQVLFYDCQQSADEKLNAIRKIVQTYSIKLVHLHFGGLEPLFLSHCKELDVKLVIHDHFDFVTHRSQLRQRLSTLRNALLYRRCGAFCVSVMKKKDAWYRLLGKQHHAFVPNGLSLRRAEQDQLTREERRQEIGLKADEKLVLFLGWDMYRKGLDIAIKATEIYRNKDHSLKIGVIGAGIDGKPEKKTIQFLQQAGIDPFSDAVIYMHSYEDIFALQRAVDCYISSSRAEAFSYGILEAISQNTPVVVSDIVGTNWCWQYDNCFRYPVEDPAVCAEALQKALVRGRAPSNSADFIRKYSNDVWTKRIVSIYRQL